MKVGVASKACVYVFVGAMNAPELSFRKKNILLLTPHARSFNSVFVSPCRALVLNRKCCGRTVLFFLELNWTKFTVVLISY